MFSKEDISAFSRTSVKMPRISEIAGHACHYLKTVEWAARQPLILKRVMLHLTGVPRLVQLCRNSDERNNSDAVLVACLVNKPFILI